MINVKGKYCEAKVFTDNIEETALKQVETLCNQETFKGSNIRIMPDVHAGKGSVIGFTAKMTDKIIPNIVGVDIGCGMLTVPLGNCYIDLKELDEVIHAFVPSGFDVYINPLKAISDYNSLKCFGFIKKNIDYFDKSIGTLGGGNHFIEIDRDENNDKYLIIHTGSRNLGATVASHYQKLAVKKCSSKHSAKKERDKIISKCKSDGRKYDIKDELNAMVERIKETSIPHELAYLECEDKENYLYDMKACQRYAKYNREQIARTIICKMNFKEVVGEEPFHTIHNYIDFKDKIIRKGAIQANKGQKVLIPINMRDGCILGIGKGNEDYNNSAPHGAGRLMSRTQAKAKISLDEFHESMNGIYTTSVNESTLDESPMAYKGIEEILNNINDTVDVIKILKPIYSFKDSK